MVVKAGDDIQGGNALSNGNKLHFDIDELEEDHRRFARQATTTTKKAVATTKKATGTTKKATTAKVNNSSLNRDHYSINITYFNIL